MKAEYSRADHKRSDLSQTKLRSAITNGSALLSDLDHRGAWARRLRDLIGLHLADLGGEDAVSESEKVLVRRAAMLTLQLELMEQRFSQNEGGEARMQEIESYQRATNTLRRLLETLGLERRQRDVTPEDDQLTARFLEALEVSP